MQRMKSYYRHHSSSITTKTTRFGSDLTSGSSDVIGKRGYDVIGGNDANKEVLNENGRRSRNSSGGETNFSYASVVKEELLNLANNSVQKLLTTSSAEAASPLNQRSPTDSKQSRSSSSALAVKERRVPIGVESPATSVDIKPAINVASSPPQELEIQVKSVAGEQNQKDIHHSLSVGRHSSADQPTSATTVNAAAEPQRDKEEFRGLNTSNTQVESFESYCPSEQLDKQNVTSSSAVTDPTRTIYATIDHSGQLSRPSGQLLPPVPRTSQLEQPQGRGLGGPGQSYRYHRGFAEESSSQPEVTYYANSSNPSSPNQLLTAGAPLHRRQSIKSNRSRRSSLRRGSGGIDMQRTASSTDLAAYEGCGEGSRRLQLISNFILLVSSLVMIGIGSGLMGFYRIHMLEVITVEFLIVPLVLVIGGITMLLTGLFGFFVTMKESSCLMVSYSILMALNFVVLMTGIVSSVRLLFDIQTGLFDADVIPELTLYETDSWVRHKWDTIQREFTCCGGYGYTVGYTDWKHTLLGGAHNSVPDSCCLYETPQCGAKIFEISDLRVVIGKIHTHGCLTVMLRRLESHVTVILIVFSVVGGVIAILELLTIVLACCFANQIAKIEEENAEWDYDPAPSRMSPPPPPPNPHYHPHMTQPNASHHHIHQQQNSRRPSYASQHETVF